MSVRVIETTPEDVLYRRYGSQTNAQGCYIELDLREGTLLADYNAEVGNAVPGAVFHGFERRYPIPALTGTAANDLMYQMAPLADRILAHWESEWNGNNNVAVLGQDARDAEEEIEKLLGMHADTYDGDPDQGFSNEDLVTVWDVDGATNGNEVEEYDITADTTDERLDEIEEEIRTGLAEVSDSPVVVLDGVAEYLRNLRYELALQAVEDATEAAGEAAEAATAAALTRARTVARFVDLAPTQRDAARRLGLDQSTVNKLVRKARG